MRLIGAPVVFAALCVGAPGIPWPVLEAAPARMTHAAIEEAIAYGAARQPEPYLLRHAGAEDNPEVVAAVYTPFLRLAYLSHAAARRGERLDPAALPAAVTEPHAYIAFRWYCCEPADALQLAGVKPQVLMLPQPARSAGQLGRDASPFKTLQAGVRPAWLTEGSDVLRTFGAEPPFDDIALVAGYPLDTLTVLRTFVVYKWLLVREDGGEVPAPQSGSFRYGVLRAADAARWR